jgi:hypothetical protein
VLAEHGQNLDSISITEKEDEEEEEEDKVQGKEGEEGEEGEDVGEPKGNVKEQSGSWDV